MGRIDEIFDVLKTFKPYLHKSDKNKYDCIARYFRIFVVIGLVCLCMIFLLFKYALPNNELLRSFGLINVIFIYIAFLGSLIIPVVPAVIAFVKNIFQKRDIVSLIDYSQKSIMHDEEYAQILNKYFEYDELQYAHNRLSILIGRYDNRIKLFFEKGVTATSIFGILYLFLQNVDVTSALMNIFSSNSADRNLWSWVVIMVLAFIFGLLIGAILLKILIQRYTFWQDVVKIAMQQVELKKIQEESLNTNDSKFTWLQRIKRFLIEA